MTTCERASRLHPLTLHLFAALCLGTAGGALAQNAAGTLPAAGTEATPTRPGERLSQWLLQQSPRPADPGVAWLVPQEKLPQQYLRNVLLIHFERSAAQRSGEDRAIRQRLLGWLHTLPATGRVALGIVDPRWLEVNPGQDPVAGDRARFVLPQDATGDVVVVQPDGTLCHVRHASGRWVGDYLRACGRLDGTDWAWIAQADGRTARMGVAAWNREAGVEPAPGAWVWAPPRSMEDMVAASEGLIKFLGTQGPAPSAARAAFQPVPTPNDGAATTPVPTPALPGGFAATGSLPAMPAAWPRPLDGSANDWGEIGLLQTPTARMSAAGEVRTSYSSVWPYSRLNVMFQPFDWMEAGFRYTSVSNREYGPQFPNQSYKDKSIDVKFRLLRESARVPELSLGFRDIGGTGLFSSEYFVANKRFGDLDVSLGIGWGYLGASGNISNPLRLISNRFATRPGSDNTGEANLNAYFRGPAALFGGVQWQTPWYPLTLKLEYDGNNYQNEPLANPLPRRSPLNVGLAYKLAQNVTLSAGFERGERFMIGLTVGGNLSTAQVPKLLDPPPPNFVPGAPANPPGWQETAAQIEAQTGWRVLRIAPNGDVLHLWVTDANTVYRDTRTERAVAVLHRDAPAAIRSFVIHYEERGLPLHAQAIARDEWVRARTEPLPPHLARDVTRRDYAPEPQPQPDTLLTPVAEGKPGQTGAAWLRPTDTFTFGVSPYFNQIIGGPNSFALVELGARASAQYNFSQQTWLQGTVNLRLADNYKGFTYDAPSGLPRVRTDQRLYLTTSRVTIPNLQLTHVGQLTKDQFYSVYGGYLEPMFAGVGAEWLYRPWGSRWAFGIDVNRVRQREFDQHLGLRDYRVNTGHASLYWNTGWNGVLVRVSAGQYLAGDRGATLDIAKRFDNGLTLGAYATKTNVSAAQFGEGSFDKGIYLSIPLDALLPRSSRSLIGFNWSPLTRDGGARLGRAVSLYDLTYIRDPDAFRFGPPPSQAPRAGDNILDFDAKY
ncbi:YjbH domain-containing protein [Pseudacidovorax intermedius]|uniref:YjbH domain-containing protein n=1 Tax=Pseudacidovorax intermedius TaxID=433924 RepID=UPI000733DEA5|nr:YjbH domain-containing protein [Pseudacidovorax intermedius]